MEYFENENRTKVLVRYSDGEYEMFYDELNARGYIEDDLDEDRDVEVPDYTRGDGIVPFQNGLPKIKRIEYRGFPDLKATDYPIKNMPKPIIKENELGSEIDEIIDDENAALVNAGTVPQYVVTDSGDSKMPYMPEDPLLVKARRELQHNQEVNFGSGFCTVPKCELCGRDTAETIVLPKKRQRGMSISLVDVRDLLARNIPVSEIAKKFGCSIPTIYNAKKKIEEEDARTKPEDLGGVVGSDGIRDLDAEPEKEYPKDILQYGIEGIKLIEELFEDGYDRDEIIEQAQELDVALTGWVVDDILRALKLEF